MRKVKFITTEEELALISKLVSKLKEFGFNSSNSVIVTVSTDYSSIIGQILRHQLSIGGEICEGFGVDVPYPDEIWDSKYITELSNTFKNYAHLLKGKTLILVEAGVIRGGNYKFLTDWMRENYGSDLNIKTVAMLENVGSRFKSDIVAEYYDDTTEDLTFWWETENNHWKIEP